MSHGRCSAKKNLSGIRITSEKYEINGAKVDLLRHTLTIPYEQPHCKGDILFGSSAIRYLTPTTETPEAAPIFVTTTFPLRGKGDTHDDLSSNPCSFRL
jgi:hypothetical protein